jgi:putative ABC transport system permease protein
MKRAISVVFEALASARSQPVASAISVLIIAGMVGSVLLTTGRTVGSEQAVLDSIDSAGTRSIVIRAEPGAGVDTSVLSRIRNVEGIAWAGAFGQAVDVTNVAIEGGARVAARSLWTLGELGWGIQPNAPLPNRSAWASRIALEELGMATSSGGLVGPSGQDYALVGELDTPDFLTFLEPLVLVPQSSTDGLQSVSVLVIIASRPDLVSPLAQVVTSLLGEQDPAKVSVSTSERLATLRALIEGQLGSYGRTLVLIIFGVSAVLVAVVLYGLVTLRRKDFGRRRALGASQGLIIALVLVQVASLGVASSILGTAVALAVLGVAGDPLPALDFILALDVLAVAVAIVAGTVPAVIASRREPIVELRVP